MKSDKSWWLFRLLIQIQFFFKFREKYEVRQVMMAVPTLDSNSKFSKIREKYEVKLAPSPVVVLFYMPTLGPGRVLLPLCPGWAFLLLGPGWVLLPAWSTMKESASSRFSERSSCSGLWSDKRSRKLVIRVWLMLLTGMQKKRSLTLRTYLM